jgi:hypothetical protein
MPLTPPAAGPAPRQRPPQQPMPSPARKWLQRELIIYGVAVGCGLILMPFLIWGIGSRVLGPYIHGDNPHASPFALFGDFWVGLAHGSAVFWIVALGPALAILLARSLLALLRVIPSAGREPRA